MNPHERGRQLIEALLCGSDKKALRLLKEKKDVNFTIENKGDNSIHLAARRGQLRLIRYMKRRGVDLQQRNVHGNVALHYAAKGGYLDLVSYLHDKGAEMNIHNDDGESPLHEAVKTQTMDIIEELVDLGMNPDVRNTKTGETPLHTALRYGAEEAMEGLLIKGAKATVINNEGKRPEDVANNKSIKGSLRMYTTMLLAVSAGYIKAKGFKITRKDVSKPFKIDRVGVVIESIDIPKEFPTGFYCRREMVENSTVTLSKFEDETVYSDVFYIRIFEVNRNCKAKIYLPLYKSPSTKEQLIIRFIHSTREAQLVDCETANQVHYCLLEVELVPETNCICVVNARPKMEENVITAEGKTIVSEMDKDFAIEVQPGSFEEETILSLKVFESQLVDDEKVKENLQESQYIDNTENGKSTKENALLEEEERDEEGNDETWKDEEGKDEKGLNEEENDSTLLPESGNTQELKTEPKDDPLLDDTERIKRKPNIGYQSDLVTDIYQINVSGKQPTKSVKLQIPFHKGVDTSNALSIIGANEKTLNDESDEIMLEVLPVSPQVVGMNVIFEVSHFSIYVASWKKKTSVKEELRELQDQINSARERRKPAAFFAVAKQVEGRKHVLVVECVMASKSLERRQKWVNEEGYEEQSPPETDPILLKPGDTYCIDIEGNATLDDRENAAERKIQFSQCRASWQPYQLTLHENIFEEAMACACVKILKISKNGLEETSRLQIKLKPPPRPILTTPAEPPPRYPSPTLTSPAESVVQEQTTRPKSVGLLKPRVKPLRPKSSIPLSTEDKIAEITSRIGKQGYKPERPVKESLIRFFRRGNSMT